MLKSKDLQNAAEDFRYLLNHGYPKKASLELVGNRYGLTADQRHLLHRGIFSSVDSESRRKKRVSIERICNQDLVIDGYNVIITIETGLSNQPLILGDDRFIRDISGLSSNFKKTEKTERAIQLILDVIEKVKPRYTLFLFDAPMSKSGELAQLVREGLRRKILPGDATAVKVPEKMLIGFSGVIATSDTAIIDSATKVADLAGYILKKIIHSASILQWRKKRGSFGKSRRLDSSR